MSRVPVQYWVHNTARAILTRRTVMLLCEMQYCVEVQIGLPRIGEPSCPCIALLGPCVQQLYLAGALPAGHHILRYRYLPEPE
jgi:hypothetical protein